MNRGSIYMLEAKAWNGSAETTLRYCSDRDITTAATDTPPSTLYKAAIVQPGNYQASAFDDGKTFGASKISVGEAVLDNLTGSLDSLIDYAFDGRETVLRAGFPGSAYPGSYETIYTAIVEQPLFNWTSITLKLRDKQASLDIPIIQDIFAGGNSLPLGLEGNDSDIKGQIKPLVLGSPRNISPPCCNTALLIYAVSVGTVGTTDNVTDWDGITDFDAVTDFFGSRSEGCSNVVVYDKGAALTIGPDYADENDMFTNAPDPGTYRVWPAGGYFRLGSKPNGLISCDCSDNSGQAPTAKNLIIRALTKYAGWSTGSYSAADMTALDSQTTAAIGIFITQNTPNVSDVLDMICNSIGGCWTFDAAGIFRVFIVGPPTGTADFAINGNMIKQYKIERKSTTDTGKGVPAWKVRVRYAYNYTVQSSDIDGTVDPARRTFLAQEWREVSARNDSVKSIHPLSPEMPFDTWLIDPVAAQAEADRRLAIYSTRRDRLEMTLDLDALDLSALRIGSVMTLDLGGRYSYSGKKMLCLGFRFDFKLFTLVLTLWG